MKLISGNGNKVQHKDRAIADKERTIQILLNQNKL